MYKKALPVRTDDGDPEQMVLNRNKQRKRIIFGGR